MHDYSIDRHPKEKIIFVLAFLAIASAPKISGEINSVLIEAKAQGWITSAPVVAIPVFLLFVLLYLLFDRFLWRVKPFRSFFLVPDLNGDWECDGRGILKEGNQVDYPWQGRIAITQSWSKISISMSAGQSNSDSVSASISHVSGRGFRVLYHYRNEPKPGEDELQIHHGSAELMIDEDCETGSGYYFTDQHRSTVGTMTLRRINADGE